MQNYLIMSGYCSKNVEIIRDQANWMAETCEVEACLHSLT